MNQRTTETKSRAPNRFVLSVLAVFFLGTGVLALDLYRADLAHYATTFQFQEPDEADAAINLVIGAVESDVPNITSDLRSRKNPKGDGIFVYVDAPKRPTIWLVLDTQAYALNSPAKQLTPSLPWPIQALPKLWRKTGIDQHSGAETAEKILY